MNSILNKSFQNLKEISEKNKNFFLNAKPFSHIEFNNFFDDQYLEKILATFPDENFKDYDHNLKNETEVKLAINSPEKIPDKINSFIEYLNSYSFLNFLQNLTGIREKLIPDPYLFGGGLHQIKRGGFLKIHSDFNVHPQMRLNRRINLLLYLNKDWKEEWGGQLELWDQQMKSCQVKVKPNFNKMVIFKTTDFSFHGHPKPLMCPERVSRKSIALYYYTNGRPKEEVDPKNGERGQTTLFRRRKGSEEDFTTNRIIFKKIFGSFYIRKKDNY
jgi:Rps23 Pro-64 3,4-dihydroxylase Tpa1-like proline 4-hydroxylase